MVLLFGIHLAWLSLVGLEGRIGLWAGLLDVGGLVLE